jgi:hypothetical protein
MYGIVTLNVVTKYIQNPKLISMHYFIFFIVGRQNTTQSSEKLRQVLHSSQQSLSESTPILLFLDAKSEVVIELYCDRYDKSNYNSGYQIQSPNNIMIRQKHNIVS